MKFFEVQKLLATISKDDSKIDVAEVVPLVLFSDLMLKGLISDED